MYNQPIMAACASAACQQDTSLSICEHSTEHSGAHQCCNKQTRCELTDNVMERHHRDIDKYADGCAKCGTKGNKADKNLLFCLHGLLLLVDSTANERHEHRHKQPCADNPQEQASAALRVFRAIMLYCLYSWIIC